VKRSSKGLSIKDVRSQGGEWFVQCGHGSKYLRFFLKFIVCWNHRQGWAGP